MKGNTPKTFRPLGEEETLSIEVTTRCNGSCLHCFARSGIPRSSSLPLTVVKGIVGEGYETGYRHLHFTGGEPLLWQGLFQALDRAFGVGYETVLLNTNGTLMTKETSRKLAAYQRLSMSVSVDGPESLHDRMRGKGSHRRAMRGIERALHAGIPITIFTTATKTLVPELPYFIDDLYTKFPRINYVVLIQLIRMTHGPFALSEELLEPEDFIRLVRMVGFLHLGGLRTIVKKNPLANVVSQMLTMPWIPPVPPLYHEGCMIVMATRHIGLVHSNRKSFGKYRRGMIRKVLASDDYQKAVAPDQTTCPSCKFAQLCRENGMIRPPQGYGDLSEDMPYCRRVLDRIALTRSVRNVKPNRRAAYAMCLD